MAQAVSLDIYQLLEDKLGREEAKKVADAIEVVFEAVEKKADAVALQKKLEIEDELTKRLASKADIARLEIEIKRLEDKMATKADIAALEGKINVLEEKIIALDTKFKYGLIIIVLTIIIVNKDSLEFLARVLGLIK